PPSVAELRLAGPREGDDRREPRDSLARRAVVPRRRRPAALARVGRDGDDRAQVPARLSMVCDVPRARDLPGRARVQRPGRARPRRARSDEPAPRAMTLILRRIPLLIVVLAAISLAVFLLAQQLPGDPAFVAAGGGEATPEMIAHARERLGLDR